MTAADRSTAEGYDALVDRGGQRRRAADLLTMAGADRGRFLGNLVTCDVRKPLPGGGVFGFVTDGKGHVLADLRVLVRDDDFLLVLPPGRGAAIAAHLGKYKIVDRVEIAPADLAGTWIAGPAAADLLADLAPWSWRAATVADRPVTVSREPDRAGVAVGTVWSAADAQDDVAAALAAAGLGPVAEEAWEALRVVAGWPRFAVDYDSDAFPQETGIAGAVDYDKGCYLGQEVVARIHYRGGVARHLRGLRLASPVAPGAAVLADGREAGRATTVAAASGHGDLALAVLHRRVAPGAEVAVEAGGGSVPATVVELPFAP